ncbi:SDR family NAD(P)-dependent oxidoreductase [Allokutzneria multivorans]|uniref:SDR family NAD(P)-dependent oxidoreductase n=1 Tax=Allokutzneria multivorans TaxID=1142134 RepID=A0ABP7SFN4_9PSEU
MNKRTALVTGANRGIGKEIARQLADAGLIVHVGSRDPVDGQRAVDELGENARLLVLDVTNVADADSEAAERIGALDVLINNAGIMTDTAPPTESDVESFRRTYEANVFGVVAVTNAFLPALRRSASPRIVNISSGLASLAWSTARFPADGASAAYRTSKAAVNALTVLYAQALAGEGFKVNALGPGPRATAMNSFVGGDPAEAAAGAVRLALLPEDGPTGSLVAWDGSPIPW